jgi:hypothetical protein
LDGDQAILGEGDVLLGDGRAQHVAQQVASADVVLGEEASLPLAVVLDDMAADQVAQEPGADDLQQVSDGDVGDARQGVEHGLAVSGTSHEDSIQHDGMKVRMKFQVG